MQVNISRYIAKYLCISLLVTLVSACFHDDDDTNTSIPIDSDQPSPGISIHVNPADSVIATMSTSDMETLQIFSRKDEFGMPIELTGFRLFDPLNPDSYDLLFLEGNFPVEVYLRDGSRVMYEYLPDNSIKIEVVLPDGESTSAIYTLPTFPTPINTANKVEPQTSTLSKNSSLDAVQAAVTQSSSTDTFVDLYAIIGTESIPINEARVLIDWRTKDSEQWATHVANMISPGRYNAKIPFEPIEKDEYLAYQICNTLSPIVSEFCSQADSSSISYADLLEVACTALSSGNYPACKKAVVVIKLLNKAICVSGTELCAIIDEEVDHYYDMANTVEMRVGVKHPYFPPETREQTFTPPPPPSFNFDFKLPLTFNIFETPLHQDNPSYKVDTKLSEKFPGIPVETHVYRITDNYINSHKGETNADGIFSIEVPCLESEQSTSTANIVSMIHNESVNKYIIQEPTQSMYLEIISTNPSSCIIVGETLQLEVIARDKGGNIIPTPELVWAYDPSIATLDSNGVVTGVSGGQVRFQASIKTTPGVCDVAWAAAYVTVIDVNGRWQLTEIADERACIEGGMATYSNVTNISQVGSYVTATWGTGSGSGNINDCRITGYSHESEDGGINYNIGDVDISEDGNIMNGSGIWTWTGVNSSCTGSSKFYYNRLE